MTNRENRVTTYLTDSEYRQLKEWSDETGKSMAHLLREAVLEYTDHDRAARIEEKVDQLLTAVGDSQAGPRTHTNPGCKSVPEKARAIADHVYKNYETPIKGEDVEIAIENIADVGDERTVRKYKKQLKKRGLLFEHPLQPVWTDDKRQWVRWNEEATVDRPEVDDVVNGYNLGTAEYIELVEEMGL